MSPIAKHRLKAFSAQRGLCFYCGLPMFLRNPEELGLTARYMGLQATAEHLHARSCGGRNNAENIVAACFCCNSRRHKRARPLDPREYAEYVRTRMAAGAWHPKEVWKSLRPA